MAGFEDTKLLRHPTIERAYNEMRTFFIDGEDFAAQAVRAGELITAHAKNPDPDAIAASVLMDGMIVSYVASSFATSVSPRAAEILQNMYDFDPDHPVFQSAAEQQIVLAHSIMGLEDIREKIRSGDLRYGMEYEQVKSALDKNETVLLKVIDGADESGMAAAAVEKLLVTKTALDDLVRREQAKLAFEKTGLPEHPLVRDVYEYMRDANLKDKPLGGYTDTNTAIAKVIVDTGASTDPEVICAAMLNQYSTLHDKKAAHEFSPRIGALWEESSPWHRFGKGEEVTPTEEGRLIRHAARLYFLESTLEGLAEQAQKKEDVSPYSLEELENLKKRLDADLAAGVHPALETRLRKGVQDAERLMNAPENVKIRKPGSPPIDNGW